SLLETNKSKKGVNEMAKQYTDKELADIGRKVVEARARQAVASKARHTVQSKLYNMYKNGELGDIKV
ncbi:MAG: hypothetical protein KKD77_20740, partial [Gammaproteobacteria bacterium]|nr:hypothetical protein [Gammaproteobacteria bacterium]